MSTVELWDAVEYADGSYYQSVQTRRILDNYSFAEDANVLDIGCGDGTTSSLIASLVAKGRVLAIDRSNDMINHAQKKFAAINNLKFQLKEANSIDFINAFDNAFSAFCLHWVQDMNDVMQRVYSALKPQGKILFILAHPDCDISDCLNVVLSSDKWQKIMANYTLPLAFDRYDDAEYEKIVNQVGFKNCEVKSYSSPVDFPTIDYFKKLVSALPLFDHYLDHQQSNEIKNDMVEVFKIKNNQNQNGKYVYKAHVRVIKAHK